MTSRIGCGPLTVEFGLSGRRHYSGLHEGFYIISWGPPEEDDHKHPYVPTFGVFAESAYTESTDVVNDSDQWGKVGEAETPGFRIACESEETDDDDVEGSFVFLPPSFPCLFLFLFGFGCGISDFHV